MRILIHLCYIHRVSSLLTPFAFLGMAFGEGGHSYEGELFQNDLPLSLPC